MDNKILIIFTILRCGYSNLVGKIKSKHNDLVDLDRIFNIENLDISHLEHYENILKNFKNRYSNKLLVIRIVDIDNVPYGQIIKLLKFKINKKIIILSRDTADTYNSLRKCLETGNWNTEPNTYKKGYISTDMSEIKPYIEYCKGINDWYSFLHKNIKDLDINYTHINIDSPQIQNNIDSILSQPYSYPINPNKKKKIIVIFCTARTGSTTLCEKLVNKFSINLGELFDVEIGSSDNYYKKHKKYSMSFIITNLFDWLYSYNNIIIKIFYEHLEFISWKHITDLLNVDINKKIILLKRNNLDTYNSLVKAVSSNEWGNNLDNKQLIISNSYTHKLLTNNETYNQLINKWYIDLETIMKEKKIQYSILDFTEIIKPDFVYQI